MLSFCQRSVVLYLLFLSAGLSFAGALPELSDLSSSAAIVSDPYVSVAQTYPVGGSEVNPRTGELNLPYPLASISGNGLGGFGLGVVYTHYIKTPSDNPYYVARHWEYNLPFFRLVSYENKTDSGKKVALEYSSGSNQRSYIFKPGVSTGSGSALYDYSFGFGQETPMMVTSHHAQFSNAKTITVTTPGNTVETFKRLPGKHGFFAIHTRHVLSTGYKLSFHYDSGAVSEISSNNGPTIKIIKSPVFPEHAPFHNRLNYKNFMLHSFLEYGFQAAPFPTGSNPNYGYFPGVVSHFKRRYLCGFIPQYLRNF